MKILLRNTLTSDLDFIFELQNKCFYPSDRWYKMVINQYIKDGIVIEYNNKIIGVLFQGTMVPCNDLNSIELVDDYSDLFIKNKEHLKEIYGILMICIDPDYRKKGLAQILINKHLTMNKNKLLCLNVRHTNTNAINLYKKMGYSEVLIIKNKYYLPDEHSRFMIISN